MWRRQPSKPDATMEKRCGMFYSKKIWQMIDKVVLNIPHSSSEFPGTAKDGWENGIDVHIQRWTDWGTDRLFGMASSMDPRIHPVTFPWSRFFCDVERLENDPLEKSVRASSIRLSKESGGTLPEQKSSTKPSRLFHLK